MIDSPVVFWDDISLIKIVVLAWDDISWRRPAVLWDDISWMKNLVASLG